jgi:hypothetical protein
MKDGNFQAEDNEKDSPGTFKIFGPFFLVSSLERERIAVVEGKLMDSFHHFCFSFEGGVWVGWKVIRVFFRGVWMGNFKADKLIIT